MTAAENIVDLRPTTPAICHQGVRPAIAVDAEKDSDRLRT